MTPRQRFWTIDVQTAYGAPERYEVPMHRLARDGIGNLLRALVAKYEPLTLAEVANSFLNRRQGGPTAGIIDQPQYFADLDKSRVGYAIHAPTVSVMAWVIPNAAQLSLMRQNSDRGLR